MKFWAALDVRDARDLDSLLLALDDYEPTAIEERAADAEYGTRVFFADARHRDDALAGLPAAFKARPVDVPDEDWARRSQLQLAPIAVGRITVYPTPESLAKAALDVNAHRQDTLPSDAPDGISLLIPPSMGFGTGHHATTRLCLAALQTLDLGDLSVLDVGTGSGVLALASRRLGAGDVAGIDYDADAIQSAEENRVLNFAADRVRFEVGDFRSHGANAAASSGEPGPMPPVDVVTANLTGAMLTQYARDLLRLVRPGGTLIVSGVQAHERDDVFSALAPASPVWESEEDGWVGAVFKRPESPQI